MEDLHKAEAFFASLENRDLKKTKRCRNFFFTTENFHESHSTQFGQTQISQNWPKKRCLASLVTAKAANHPTTNRQSRRRAESRLSVPLPSGGFPEHEAGADWPKSASITTCQSAHAHRE